MCPEINRYRNYGPVPKADPLFVVRGGDRSRPNFGHSDPEIGQSREANQGSAPYSPCFEATAQVGMEEGLLRLKRMIVDFRLPIAD